MRLGDGRWRASGPEKYTFSEPDEQLAILHFHQWHVRRSCTTLGTVQIHSSPVDALIDMCRRTQAAGGSLQTTVTPAPEGLKALVISDHTLSEPQWQWLRQQLIARPKWVAQMVGIEQVGYLSDLPKPTPSPTLEEVGQLYLGRAKVSSNWRAKCKQYWAEFRNSVAVTKLREITQEHIVDYGDMILDAAETPTYARQR